MIIRFWRCALCNTLCWVTLLRVEGRLTGGHERDKREEGASEFTVKGECRPPHRTSGCYSLNVSLSSPSPSHLIY